MYWTYKGENMDKITDLLHEIHDNNIDALGALDREDLIRANQLITINNELIEQLHKTLKEQLQ